jgi:hypothetical protein
VAASAGVVKRKWIGASVAARLKYCTVSLMAWLLIAAKFNFRVTESGSHATPAFALALLLRGC